MRLPHAESEDLTVVVRRAQEGARTARETLIHLFQDRVAGFIFTLVGHDEAIEDLCHDVFVKMIAGLARLKTPESFEPWLFKIARNVCADFVRKQRLRRIFVPFERKHEQTSASPTFVDHRLEKLRSAIDDMPFNQKELLLLLAEKNWSYDELAQITSTSVSAVKSRLFRAREQLRKKILERDR